MKGLDGMDARHLSVTTKISWAITFHAPILAGEGSGMRVLHALGSLTSRGHCLAYCLLDACHYLGRSLSQRRRKGYTLTWRETP
jgi:hypothetical protein